MALLVCLKKDCPRSCRCALVFLEGPVANEVVAHYLDGRIVKGLSLDVDPARPACHIKTSTDGAVEVKLAELKALYFVRSLDGGPPRRRASAVDPDDARTLGSQQIELHFADGEQLVGLTVRYPPIKPFFFVLPADENDNNLRILVNRAALVKMDQPLSSLVQLPLGESDAPNDR